ncbi:MAG TPA: CHC2 zinc finger domain-containing protein [Candidatus Cybelea sp.]|nr:CHC2 zinc finger domain-containing protein [Candidatus Cybelea sp.]
MTTTTHGSIIERVAVADILRLAGFEEPNRSGFVSCPLHAERNASFHIVGDGTGWRCFGCGARGGVLDLVVGLKITADRASAARWLEENI